MSAPIPSRTFGLTLALATLLIAMGLPSCAPTLQLREARRELPEQYPFAVDTTANSDSSSAADLPWRSFFEDPYLLALIDSALANNQEFNIMRQEIMMTQNEVLVRKGEYLPSVGLGIGAGLEKVGFYTSQGINDATAEYAPGKEIPEHLQDYLVGFFATWELDIWKRLRNLREAAQYRYLASVEGRNFMQTELITEIAHAYYELLALDKRLEIVNRNLDIQRRALRMVRLQKEAAEVSELAVQRFTAELQKNQSRQFDLRQQILETENRINFLVGRFPQPVARNTSAFDTQDPAAVVAGLPVQLIQNRPDVREAEALLEASKLDVSAARAAFYPTLGLHAGVGLQSFKLQYFLQTPESLLYNVAADLAAPLVNRNALKAEYYTAGAEQSKAVLQYEQTLLNAYIEVVNQLSMIQNVQERYRLKQQEVETLNSSIRVSTNLFQSARADYMEVLLTQRDALEAKMELVEIKQEQLLAAVNAYRALGGGWN